MLFFFFLNNIKHKSYTDLNFKILLSISKFFVCIKSTALYECMVKNWLEFKVLWVVRKTLHQFFRWYYCPSFAMFLQVKVKKNPERSSVKRQCMKYESMCTCMSLQKNSVGNTIESCPRHLPSISRKVFTFYTLI